MKLFVIIERIKKISEVQFDHEVANLLQVKPDKLALWKHRNKIPYEEINAFCKKNRYDVNWILYGEGEKGYSDIETVFIKKTDEIETILDRIKKFSKISSDYGVSKLLGVSQSTLLGWRKRNQIPYKQIRKYCEANFLNDDYFIKGEGHAEIKKSVYRSATRIDLIPVLRITEVKKGLDIYGGGYPPDISNEWLRCPYAARDPMAFGVRIEGDSMSPKYDHGQTVVISPIAKVHSKDKSLVMLQDDRVIICEIRFSSEQITLVQFNAKNIEVKKSDIKKMFKIVCAKEL